MKSRITYDTSDDSETAAAPPPPAPTARRHGAVKQTREQHEYAASAEALAEKLGWSGPDEYVLRGITVGDAKRLLTRRLHEVHQGVRNPGKGYATGDDVAAELNLGDGKKAKVCQDAFVAAINAEVEAASTEQ